MARRTDGKRKVRHRKGGLAARRSVRRRGRRFASLAARARRLLILFCLGVLLAYPGALAADALLALLQ
jgi:hypothetical protein